MASVKVFLVVFMFIAAYSTLVSAQHGHGHSYTSVHKVHAGKFDYKIDHSKHGHFSGHAHPHGYGGFGEAHY